MFVFNGYFVAFLATLLVWVVSEAFLIIRDRKVESIGNKIKGRFVYSFFFIALLSSLLLSTVNSFNIPLNHDIRLLIGILIIWAGLFIRWWAIFSLGKFFSVVVTVQSDQKIIKNGPYKYIRHPAYTGSILISLGLGLGLGNWIGLALMFFLPLISFILRAIVEEQVMLSFFGNDYLIYKRQTKMFIPFV